MNDDFEEMGSSAYCSEQSESRCEAWLGEWGKDSVMYGKGALEYQAFADVMMDLT